MDISIQILKPRERKYTYAQSSQIATMTGCIGHLRADLGSGTEFYSNWDDHCAQLKTPEFKSELEEVINTLRFGPIYIDRFNRIIQEHDQLRYTDGVLEEVFTLEDGSRGVSIGEDKYAPLVSSVAGAGLRKLYFAEIENLENPDSRKNDAFCGAILSDRSHLTQFCFLNSSAGFGNDREWGIRVNTPGYSYLMRLNPNHGEYSLYCYCYRRDWLDKHMEQAKKGIRFITPHYQELFRIADGDQIRIITKNGEKQDRTARYIDDYHVEIGGSFGSNLYHICEFAERMEHQGCLVLPLRSSLPEECYVYVESTDEIGSVKRGEMGYAPVSIQRDKGVSKKKSVEYLNKAMGISKAQAAAMNAGSLFGWATKAADPANYNEQGELKKKPMDRGDAR